MAVAFDAKATAVSTQTTNTSPITNTTLTVGASGTLVVGVHSAAGTTSAGAATAMTWNGVTMTLVSSKRASDNLSAVYVYAIISPATGAHTCSCTFTTGSGTVANDLDVFSFTGTDITSVANCIPSANVLTDATTPAGTVYPTSAFTVTTASGDAIAAVANATAALVTSASIGTLMNIETANLNNYASLRNLAVGVTTQGRFTINTSGTPWCGVAFRIVQSSAADVLQAQIIM